MLSVVRAFGYRNPFISFECIMSLVKIQAISDTGTAEMVDYPRL